MAWLEDALGEFKKAKPPEKFLIIGVSVAAVGIAVYLHNKAAANSSTPTIQAGAAGTTGSSGSPTGGTLPPAPTPTPAPSPGTPAPPKPSPKPPILPPSPLPKPKAKPPAPKPKPTPKVSAPSRPKPAAKKQTTQVAKTKATSIQHGATRNTYIDSASQTPQARGPS